MLALIFGLAKVDVESIGQGFRARTPVKWIAGYMLFVAVGIGGLWIAQSLSFVFSGKVPQFIVDVAHPTSVVFAVDLSLVVPFLLSLGLGSCRLSATGIALETNRGELYAQIIVRNLGGGVGSVYDPGAKPTPVSVCSPPKKTVDYVHMVCVAIYGFNTLPAMRYMAEDGLFDDSLIGQYLGPVRQEIIPIPGREGSHFVGIRVQLMFE